MKFGVCIGGDASKIVIAKQLGFDYVESCFALPAEDSDEDYARFCDELKKNDIPCLSVNCFLPSSLKVTGEAVNYAALREYIERGMRRASDLGIEKVVFGSSGARNLPKGYPFEKGINDLVYFLREIVSPIALACGITVVIEPLSPKDANIIQSVKEGAFLASAVNRENIRLLCDLYHMCNVADTPEDIVAMKGLLKHAHIAEPKNRRYPAPGDEYDYKSFTDALAAAGCETCSLEAGTSDFASDAAKAMEVFRTLR